MSQTAPPTVSVHPTRAMVDEKFSVLVENLPPGFPVTIRSLHHSEDRDYWEAYGHYISNHNGTVSVTEDASLGGTYAGKEPMGLLWSMRPVPGSRPGLRLRKLDVSTPMLVSISVYSGHEDFRDQTPLASSLTERWYLAPGVQRIGISEKGVSGTLFIPPGPGPFPGILDLWGGGGGLLEYRAALLASHGYASLALEYIRTGETKSTNLELEHFEMAFDILKNHPQVMSDRVGIIGLSFGSLVALYMATESIHVKPLCLICISNIHIKPPGKYLSGFQEWLTPNIIARNKDNHQIWRNANLILINEPSLKLNVGKMNCPVLLVNGCDDQNWPAVETAADIAKMMREAGKGNLLTKLDYPDTVALLWGGQTKPHSDAQEDSWRKILSFLQQHLYCIPGHRAKL